MKKAVTIATTAYNSNNNDTTILEFLQKVHPEIKKERWLKVGEIGIKIVEI